jgi:hypothetical protein
MEELSLVMEPVRDLMTSFKVVWLRKHSFEILPGQEGLKLKGRNVEREIKRKNPRL